MKYTVVGYWRDNEQPWIEWVDAKSPTAAARDAIHAADEPESLVIIDVFEGHNMGKLKNEKVVPYEEL